MPYFSIDYLSDPSAWSQEETEKIQQTLLNAYNQGEKLTRLELNTLYRVCRLLRHEPYPTGPYVFTVAQLRSKFPEGAFHDCFLMYWSYNNLTGLMGPLRNVPYVRDIDLNDDIQFLNKAEEGWLNMIGKSNGDRLIVQLNKDRKYFISKIKNQKNKNIIGRNRFNYLVKNINLISYDICLMVLSIFEYSSGGVYDLGEVENDRFLLSPEAFGHILMTHFFPDTFDGKGIVKSHFGFDVSPFKIVEIIRKVVLISKKFKVFETDDKYPKIDFSYKKVVYRIRFERVGGNLLEVKTYHPLEELNAIRDFKVNAIKTSDPLISNIC